MTLANTIASIKGKAIVDGLMLAKQPALLLRSTGDVWHVNAAAEVLLQQYFTLYRSRLAVANVDENRQLQSLIERACAAQKQFTRTTEILSPVVLRGENGISPIVVTAAPVSRSASDIAIFSGVVLMINDLSSSFEFRIEALRKVFNLTKREAEVMSLLGNGESIQEIAASLNLSVETVRYYVKSLYSKTHTNRLAELTLLCLRMQTV